MKKEQAKDIILFGVTPATLIAVVTMTVNAFTAPRPQTEMERRVSSAESMIVSTQAEVRDLKVLLYEKLSQIEKNQSKMQGIIETKLDELKK